jgi:hypothetical protein
MNDFEHPTPTHDKKLIEANGAWHIAWILCQTIDDDAPMGWGKYIPAAQKLIDEQSQQ